MEIPETPPDPDAELLGPNRVMQLCVFALRAFNHPREAARTQKGPH